MKRIKLTAAAFALALLGNAPMASAQDAAPAVPPASEQAAPPVPAEAPGAPRGDREQFRQKMNDLLKTSLKVSDEEWAVIQPLLEQVQTKQRETMAGRFGFFGGRRGGPERAGRPERPATPDADALKAALETDSASPADIKTKLEALRAARKKAAADLDQAREDLRKVLTQRQEATLVLAGILE